MKRLLSAAIATLFGLLAIVTCPTSALAATPTVSYSAHVQNVGWQETVSDGDVAGTEGQSLRLEALKVSVENVTSGGIQYRAYVQSAGWQDWVSDGAVAGTEGKSLRMESVQMQLTGELAQSYSVQYRVHVQNVGWTDWVSDGAAAGTAGSGLRIEAIQIRLVSSDSEPSVSYRAHVQNVGWQSWAGDGETAGTMGQSLRVEALQATVSSSISGGVTYRAHVQDVGWQGWASDGATAGTTGRSLRVEALQFELTGDLAEQYDIWYRVHVQNIGWMAWTSNGSTAGTEGCSLRVEAVQIVLLPKGSSSPTSSDQSVSYASLSRPSVCYSSNVKSSGWQNEVSDGVTSGTTGQSLALSGIKAYLSSDESIGGITYRVGDQDAWSSWSSDGSAASVSSSDDQVTAIQMKLTGTAANLFDVYYRVHLQNEGWLGWAKDGETAGVTSESLRVEAIQVVIVAKDSDAPGSTARHEITHQSLIYLDAGHGWSGGIYDTGATGNNYYEATETKELAVKVAYYATTLYGLNVYCNVDCDVNYSGRQAHAASMGATSLVSIHFNSAGSGATGSESYIFTPVYANGTYYDGVAAPGSSTIQDIMHQHLVSSLGLLDRGEKQDAFSVTNGASTGIPATLLEICFISNSYDMKTYKAREDAVARSLAAGLYEVYQAGY